jgi:predicted dinucleotide-binding enzyme
MSGRANADASRGPIVILAVNADSALTRRGPAAAIGSTPVLSVASEPGHEGGVFPRGASLAERIQVELDAPVIAGLHSLAAASLGGEEPPEEDAFVCGDDADAKTLALELAGRVITGRALDAGPLASARALEGLTAVIINPSSVTAHAGIRVTGTD